MTLGSVLIFSIALIHLPSNGVATDQMIGFFGIFNGFKY